MSIKLKAGFVAAAAAALGTIFLLWQIEPEDGPRILTDTDSLTRRSVTEPVNDDAPVIAENTRVALPPSKEDPSLPAAYREALGGFKGRVIMDDGEPAPGRKVELLGLKPLGFVRGMESLLDEGGAFQGLASWSTITGWCAMR